MTFAKVGPEFHTECNFLPGTLKDIPYFKTFFSPSILTSTSPEITVNR